MMTSKSQPVIYNVGVPSWEQRDSAWEKSKEMGLINGSFMKGKGRVVGFLGEEVVANFIGAEIDNTYEYDIIKDGILLDVKTKKCISEPKMHYEVSISDWNTRQKCDGYVFARIEYHKNAPKKKWGNAYILGWYPKDEYFEKARFLKEGTKDGDNGYRVRSDCWNMKIEDLYSINDFLS